MSEPSSFLPLSLFCASFRPLTGIAHLVFEHQSQELVSEKRESCACVTEGEHIEGRPSIGVNKTTGDDGLGTPGSKLWPCNYLAART